jgi:stage II sporulation protein M
MNFKKNSKKIKDFIFKNYLECWKYIKSCKIQISLVVGLFFLFSIIGFFVPAPENLVTFILDYIRELLEQTKDMSVFELISFIFLNNLQASLIGVIFGIFFGIFPIILSIFNGYLLGFVVSMVFEQEGFFSLLSLFPHGIFELPAVFISLGFGLKIGSFLFQKNKLEFLKKNISHALMVFLLVVVPLLIIASIIEGTFIFAFK